VLADEMTDATPARPTRGWHPLDAPSAIGLGVAAVALGLLPWLRTGLRLPLQNLWALDTAPGDMPRALLPFSQYAVAFIVAAIFVGGLAAGYAARLLRGRTPRGWWPVVAATVVVAQALALVQTAVAVYAGLPKQRVPLAYGFDVQLRTELTSVARPYFYGIVGGASVAIVLGLALLVLIARAPVPGFVIAVGVGAVALGVWLDFLVNPLTGVPGGAATAVLLKIVRWVPAVVLGVTLAWAGFRTAGRIVAAVVALVALWVGPALIAAVSGALGSRVLLGHPAELVDYALRVFRDELTTRLGTWPEVLVALVIGAAGAVAVTLRWRRGAAG
jgi:hypothetical protein